MRGEPRRCRPSRIRPHRLQLHAWAAACCSIPRVFATATGPSTCGSGPPSRADFAAAAHADRCPGRRCDPFAGRGGQRRSTSTASSASTAASPSSNPPARSAVNPLRRHDREHAVRLLADPQGRKRAAGVQPPSHVVAREPDGVVGNHGVQQLVEVVTQRRHPQHLVEEDAVRARAGLTAAPRPAHPRPGRAPVPGGRKGVLGQRGGGVLGVEVFSLRRAWKTRRFVPRRCCLWAFPGDERPSLTW